MFNRVCNLVCWIKGCTLYFIGVNYNRGGSMFVAIWQVSCDPDGYFLIWSCIIKLSPWSLTHKPLERISVQVLYLLCTGCNYVTSLGSCHINIQSCKKYSGVKKWLRICMITWIMQFCLVLSYETFQSLHVTQDVFMSVP